MQKSILSLNIVKLHNLHHLSRYNLFCKQRENIHSNVAGNILVRIVKAFSRTLEMNTLPRDNFTPRFKDFRFKMRVFNRVFCNALFPIS